LNVVLRVILVWESFAFDESPHLVGLSRDDLAPMVRGSPLALVGVHILAKRLQRSVVKLALAASLAHCAIQLPKDSDTCAVFAVNGCN
jgi:hypothetical protein